MTVTLPEPMKDWVETQISRGEYASASDYVRELIRRDRELRAQPLTLNDLQNIVADSKASGISSRTVYEIFAHARKAAGADSE
jgi:antitoxin ParD1/3/4